MSPRIQRGGQANPLNTIMKFGGDFVESLSCGERGHMQAARRGGYEIKPQCLVFFKTGPNRAFDNIAHCFIRRLSPSARVVAHTIDIRHRRSLQAVEHRIIFGRAVGDLRCCHADSHKHRVPLDRRVAVIYSSDRLVNPSQGIGLPVSKGAARATRPVWARFFMVGRVASTARCAVPLAVRPIVARPATSIGLLRPDVFKGKRP